MGRGNNHCAAADGFQSVLGARRGIPRSEVARAAAERRKRVEELKDALATAEDANAALASDDPLRQAAGVAWHGWFIRGGPSPSSNGALLAAFDRDPALVLIPEADEIAHDIAVTVSFEATGFDLRFAAQLFELRAQHGGRRKVDHLLEVVCDDLRRIPPRMPLMRAVSVLLDRPNDYPELVQALTQALANRALGADVVARDLLNANPDAPGLAPLHEAMAA